MGADKELKKGAGAGLLAAEILAGTSSLGVDHYIRDLGSPSKASVLQAARVLDEIVSHKPGLVAPHIARLAQLLASDEPRVVQACANSLPELAKLAPAKVAKQLPALREVYARGSEAARDGVVRTYVALCVASIAYQKRLIDVLEAALTEADPDTLARWSQLVLPALKGEPHARARELVERRLPELPNAPARKIADLLGVRLRPSRAPGA